eukprot:14125952-Alexandrium_andersonii.AAC.1
MYCGLTASGNVGEQTNSSSQRTRGEMESMRQQMSVTQKPIVGLMSSVQAAVVDLASARAVREKQRAVVVGAD